MDYFYVLVFVILAVIILLMTDQLRKADKQLVALKTKLGDTEAMLSSARYTREKDQKSLSAHQEHIERLETEIRP